jgi:hypothetical protein
MAFSARIRCCFNTLAPCGCRSERSGRLLIRRRAAPKPIDLDADERLNRSCGAPRWPFVTRQKSLWVVIALGIAGSFVLYHKSRDLLRVSGPPPESPPVTLSATAVIPGVGSFPIGVQERAGGSYSGAEPERRARRLGWRWSPWGCNSGRELSASDRDRPANHVELHGIARL